MHQSSIRITFSKNILDILEQQANILGIKKTEYIRSLVIEDLKKLFQNKNA